MKKIIIILLTILLIGCKKEENNIITLINENDNCISSINYPITEEKKLNKKIKKYINTEINNFQKNYCNKDTRQELNIDFKKETINNFILVTLKTEIENTSTIKSFIFNTKTKKFSTLNKILNENDLKIIQNHLNQKLEDLNINKNIIQDITIENTPFFITQNNLILYINLNKIIEINIPLEQLSLKTEKKETSNYTYKEINKIVNPEEPVIALTFDDGPSKYTKKIIDLLNQYNANATFFILGNKVETYKETLKYLLDSGNEIGNHSYNHKWLTHVTKDELLNQINETQNIIHENLNYTPKLFRPTYGSINKNIKENIKLDIILWNIDTLDWKYKNSNKIVSHVLPKIKDGKIVLMHDTYEYTYNALKILLPKLKDQGFQFVTVSELQEINKIRKIK